MSNFKRKIQRLKNKLYKGNPYYDQEVIKSIAKRKQANKKAIELVKQNKSEYTDEEKKELARYTGQGALGVGDGDEFYTPKEVAKSLFNMIDLQGGETILEPASGTGVIIGQAPKDIKFIGCELNKISGKIADILNDNADIQAGVSFEEYSKNIPENSIDCIVSNVPFSNRDNSFRQIDEKYKHLTRNEDYFILKSLDLLKPTKQANFLTTSSTIQRKSKRSVRNEILSKASFIGGYRLPSEMFKEAGTEQVVDILVFEKHPIKILQLIDNNNFQALDKIKENKLNKQFLEGTYFNENPKQVFGNFISKEEMIAEAEAKGIQLHHLKQKDTVTLPKGVTIDDVKQELLKTKPFKNTTDYKAIFEVVTNIKLDDISTLNEYDESMVTKQSILNEFYSLNNENKLPNISDYEEFEKNYQILNDDDKNDEVIEEYYQLRKFTSLYGAFESLIIYLIIQEATNYKQEYLIENKDKIQNLLDTYKKNLTKTKLKGKIKNHIISVMGLLENFDLEIGKFRDIYEELEKEVELEKQHPLAKKLDTLSEIEKNEKVGYDNGIMAINKSLYTKKELEKDTSIVAVGNKVYAIEEYFTTSLPDNYYKALEFVDELNLLNSEKQKLMNLLNERKQTLIYDDINVDVKNIKNYVDISSLHEIERLLSQDKVLKKALIELIKQDVKTDNKEVKYQNITAILKSNWFDTYISNLINGKSATIFEQLQYIRNIKENYFNDNYAENMAVENAYEHLKAVIRNFLSSNIEVINATLREILNENDKFIQQINETLNKKSIIVKEINPQGSDEPLNELASYVKPEILTMARHYQNSDARYFGANLRGTIAQDTGLGKSITMLLTALYSIKTKSAKRVMLITPKSVYEKFITNEVPKVLKEDFIKNNLLTFNTDKLEEGARELKVNKNIRMVIVPQSTFEMIGLKNDTIEYLYGYDKSNSNEDIYKFGFYGIGVKKWQPKDVRIYFEDLGIDALLIDEAHFYKNSMSVLSNVKGLGGSASDRAIGTLYKAEYIRMKKGNRKGVVAVTATPTTSSPQEILAMMLLNGSLENKVNAKEFLEYFCNIEDKLVETITGRKTTKQVLVGIQNLRELRQLGWDKIVYRNAEGEQEKAKAMGKTINVKPPYEEINVNIERDDQIIEFDVLKEVYSTFSSVIYKIKRSKTDPLKIDEYQFDLIKKYGEVFGYFGRAKLISVSPDFSLEVTKVKLNDNFTYEKLEKALKNKKIVYKQAKVFKTKLDYEVKNVEHKFTIFEWYESKFYELRKNLKLVREMIEEENGNVYLNIPTKDYKELKGFITALQKEKLIDSGNMFEIGVFKKIGVLLNNMDKEFSRHPLSKQIIYATTMTTHLILQDLFKEKYPDSKVFIFNGVEVKNDDIGLKIQDIFNESETPDILIFNQKGQVGVDFNKNVSSVHLVDIPDTPDQWHQAMGRAVRQGNKIDKVNVYKYIKLGTFDEFMIDLVSNKSDWIESLKDKNKNDSSIDNSSVEEIYSRAIMYYSDKDWDDATKIKKYQEMIENKSKLKQDKIKEMSFNKKMNRFNDIVKEFENYEYAKQKNNWEDISYSNLNLTRWGDTFNHWQTNDIFRSFGRGLQDLAYKKEFKAYTKILQQIEIFKKQIKDKIISSTKTTIYELLQKEKPTSVEDLFKTLQNLDTKKYISELNVKGFNEKFEDKINTIKNEDLKEVYEDKIPKGILENLNKAIQRAFDNYGGTFSDFITYYVNEVFDSINTEISRLENLQTTIKNYRVDLINSITENLILGNGHHEEIVATYIDETINKISPKSVIRVNDYFIDISQNTFIAKYDDYYTLISVKGSLEGFYYDNGIIKRVPKLDEYNISQIKILTKQDINEMYNENNEEFIKVYEYAMSES